jgi:hypothetical protein
VLPMCPVRCGLHPSLRKGKLSHRRPHPPALRSMSSRCICRSHTSTSPILMPQTAVAAISGPSVHPARGDEQEGQVLFSAAPQ